MTRQAIKFAEGADGLIEGLAAPFGGPFNGKDLEREFFSAKTDFVLSWFDEIPLLYAHGKDKDVELEVVGRVKSRDLTDAGVWAKAQLDKQSQYFDAISDLVANGKLYFSSGAMPHLVQTNKKSGEILRWPWVELSLTTTPMNLFATVEQAKAIKHFEAAGLETDALTSDDALKAAMTTDTRNALSDSQFAYIDSEGGRHLPVNDEAHARAALGGDGFTKQEFESPAKRKSAARKILSAARKFGIDVADDSEVAMAAKAWRATLKEMSFEDRKMAIEAMLNPSTPFYNAGPQAYVCCVETFDDHVIVSQWDGDDQDYYSIDYTVDPDTEMISLSTPVEVEQTYVPVAVRSVSERPLRASAMDATQLIHAVAGEAKALAERRTKEARVLSSRNHSAVGTVLDAYDAMTEPMGVLRDLHTSTMPDMAKATDAHLRFLAYTTRLRHLQVV